MDLKEVLEYIPASDLEYQEWVNIGMALKTEGYPCSVWDAWSQKDSRYHDGECERKWKTFHESSSSPVTGGTIVEIAKRYGYTHTKREVVVFGWDDEIQYDGDPDRVIKDVGWLNVSDMIEAPSDKNFDGPNELRRYIRALYKDDDYVGYCIDAEYDETDDKWHPSSSGVYGFTAKQILDTIKRHPLDIRDTIGDYNEKAGAWIRFNPLDGHGVGNDNVAEFRYTLVESDHMAVEKQKAIMEELKLPIAIMVYSGKKSVHSIVRVGAINRQEYQERVDYIYKTCEKNGLSIDKQNKNSSRMSRMPGVFRDGKKQFIIAENIGLPTFEEWKEYIEDAIDQLPDIINYSSLESLPPLSPELISGILRRGHKMLISGASKAGKSFLLIELALCITSGQKWLGFDCAKGKVLYINLEVDGASFLHRVDSVREQMGIDKVSANLDIWNLRGENAAIDKLAPRLIRRATGKDYDAIIFDPLYKINQNDENSASEMAKFFNQLDLICTKLKTSIICCHHHSKGAQGGKFSMDRASGSGVFARDPDALLDMIQINPKDADINLETGNTAWRISATLREFRTPDDIDVEFAYPIHRIRTDLKTAKPMSGADSSTNSKRGNAAKADNRDSKYDRLLTFVDNWAEIDTKPVKTPHPTLGEAAEYFKSDKGFSERSIRRWIEDGTEAFIQNGMIILRDEN